MAMYSVYTAMISFSSIKKAPLGAKLTQRANGRQIFNEFLLYHFYYATFLKSNEKQ